MGFRLSSSMMFTTEQFAAVANEQIFGDLLNILANTAKHFNRITQTLAWPSLDSIRSRMSSAVAVTIVALRHVLFCPAITDD